MLSKVLLDHWFSNIDIREFKIVIFVAWIVTCDEVICSHHLLHVDIYEVVKGINMLFYKTS